MKHEVVVATMCYCATIRYSLVLVVVLRECSYNAQGIHNNINSSPISYHSTKLI